MKRKIVILCSGNFFRRTYFALLWIFLSILPMFSSAQIIQPNYNSSTYHGLEITQVDRLTSNTIVHLKITCKGNDKICAGSGFYIRDTDTNIRYKLVRVYNIPMCPQQK